MKKKTFKTTILVIIFVIIVIINIFPLLWLFIAGFKPKIEVIATPFSFFPKNWTLDNYLGLLTGKLNSLYFPRGTNFLRSIFVTLGVSLIAVTLSILFNSMAAYVFARLEFKGKKVLWIYYLLTMFIPSISVLIPGAVVVNYLKLNKSLFALILPGVTYVWSIFFYRQFYLNMPRAIEEAALIDGCSRWQTYFKVFMPMSKTPFVIMGISVFQGFWNAFLWPMIIMRNPKYYQVNQLIGYFRSSSGIEWHYLVASSFITAIPLLVILIIFQKQIMEGIKIQGMK